MLQEKLNLLELNYEPKPNKEGFFCLNVVEVYSKLGANGDDLYVRYNIYIPEHQAQVTSNIAGTSFRLIVKPEFLRPYEKKLIQVKPADVMIYLFGGC
jgi:hypothetical protein